MSESQDAALVGELVLADRYELRELIGQGGMAEVHRAHDRLLDRRVAVKVFRRRDDPAAQSRFDDEAHALARLAHPGLVAIFDVGAVADRPFLVMEFVEGTSLRARLLSGPLPLDEVLRIGGVLADALAHAHHRGVVHRDVKPSNIMLDREGLPHLTDFGIALLVGSPRLTSVHEIIGTPAYLAPEQLSETEIGPAADVYALGLVLLECLSGEVEYPSGTCLEVALSRLHRPPRVPTGLPAEITELLAAMTATEAVDRPTAHACALRLLSALEDVRTEPQRQPVPMAPVAEEPAAWWADEDRTTSVPVAAAPVAHRGWRLAAASVAGIAAVVVALVFLLNAPDPLHGQPQTGAVGRAHSEPKAKTGVDRGGTGPHGSAPTEGSLVAREHPASANGHTTASAPPSAAARKSQPAPATPPPTATPTQTTVPTQPPTTESSDPPAPSTSDAPRSTTDAPSNGPGGGSGP
ncbi:MAG TPA: serine/threonine-protein kinase [Pseudonocardiaceae bacterium]|jgi:tRNA A-37 threonylcarbamoyl transferase component Bud32|nr:serine/threonine-protein kinase [Pseudonocardiaceae bacterium]